MFMVYLRLDLVLSSQFVQQPEKCTNSCTSLSNFKTNFVADPELEHHTTNARLARLQQFSVTCGYELIIPSTKWD